MLKDRTRPRTSIQSAACMGLLAAMVIGVGACGSGATHDATTAAAVKPANQSAGSSVGLAAAVPTPAAPSSAVPASAGPAPAAAPTSANSGAPTPATPKRPAAVTPAPTSHSTPSIAPAIAVTAPPPTAPAFPARRQPTAAEMNQVIASVHAQIPLFTPTAAQITKVGNEVCTAFDQGKTVAQIEGTAMQMAGAYAALIPATVANSAVRTIVTLFCSGYTSKLV